MARGGIRLIHGLIKSTLITYFSGMKIDPKYAFLHAFFLICLSCSFQNLSISFYMTKNRPFFPILHVFAPLNDVRTYSAWSWKTTLIMWIFGRAWYPLDIQVPPPCSFDMTKFAQCHFQNGTFSEQLAHNANLKCYRIAHVSKQHATCVWQWNMHFCSHTTDKLKGLSVISSG